MSQQNRQERPKHPQQAAQTAPHDNPMPPQSQTSQPEKIYVERKSNPLVMVLKVIAFPFVKIFEILGKALAIIFQELIRSILSFVIGLLMVVVFLILVVTYGYAVYLTEWDFAAAVPEMFRIFASLLNLGA